MEWKKDVSNVTGLYMEDLGRYAMLPREREILVGRRARLGYGAVIALTMPLRRLREIRSMAESGMSPKALRTEARKLVRKLVRLRKERCDLAPEDTASWPEEERWMAASALEAINLAIHLTEIVRDVTQLEGVTPEQVDESAISVSAMFAEAESRFEKLCSVGHAAVDELVKANLRFVISVAKKYQGKGLDLSELISAGNEGLIKAARKFDERMGVLYVSYAAFWIGQQIQKELDYSVGAVRPTQTQMVRNRRVWRLLSEARSKGGEVDIEALVRETGYTEARIREALDTNIAIMSLDAPVDQGDSGSATLGQFIGSDDDSAEKEEENERHDAVMKAIREVLTDREAKIIKLYFGIGGQEEWPLADIGASLNISRERARQLKERALDKLANCRLTEALREVSPVDEIDAESRYAKARLAEATLDIPTPEAGDVGARKSQSTVQRQSGEAPARKAKRSAPQPKSPAVEESLADVCCTAGAGATA